MSKLLQELPAINAVLPNSYILMKSAHLGAPTDYKITTANLFSGYLNQVDIGLVQGKLIELVDSTSDAGTGALPAVSGENLTNLDLALEVGNASTNGLIKLSDSITSTSGVANGVSATPQAIKSLNDLTVKKAGDNITGDLILDNSINLSSRNSADDANIEVIHTDTSDNVVIGEATAQSIHLQSAGLIEIKNTTGTTIFSVSQNATVTGSVKFSDLITFNNSTAGLVSADIAFTPTAPRVATNVQEAIQELADEPSGLEWIYRPAGSFAVIEGTANFAEGGDGVSSYVATLPASPEGDITILFTDKLDNWHQYPLQVNGNGNTIEGDNEIFLDVRGITVEFLWSADDNNWRIVNASNTGYSPSQIITDSFVVSVGGTYTLTKPPISKSSIIVISDGGYIHPITDYSISGDVLSFDTNEPTATTTLEVRNLGVELTLGEVPADSIDSSKFTPAFRDIVDASSLSGRNYLINGDMHIWQRRVDGLLYNTSGVRYHADRFANVLEVDVGGTMTANVLTRGKWGADGRFVKDHVRARRNFLEVTTNAGTANDYFHISQSIHDYEELSGRAFNLSFCARTDSGTANIGVELYIDTDSSTPNTSIPLGLVPISATAGNAPQSFNVQFPDFGNTDSWGFEAAVHVVIWQSCTLAEPELAFRSSNLGFSNSTISYWGFSFTEGSSPKWNPSNKGDELRLCQKYYEQSYEYLGDKSESFAGDPNNLGFIMRSTGGNLNEWISGPDFKVNKFTNATVEVYSTSGVIGNVTDYSTSTDVIIDFKTGAGTSHGGAMRLLAPASGMYKYHWTAEAESPAQT